MGTVPVAPRWLGLAFAGVLLRLGVALLAVALGAPPVEGANANDHADGGERLGAAGAVAEVSLGVGPRVYGRLSERSIHNLWVGFSLALRMVRPDAACRALFEHFDVSGVESLTSTLYAEPTDRERARICVGGVVAFTTTGSRVTKLCPEFGALHPRVAGLTLVHEALHSAGLPERPSTPSALSPQEIDYLVDRACGTGRAH